MSSLPGQLPYSSPAIQGAFVQLSTQRDAAVGRVQQLEGRVRPHTDSVLLLTGKLKAEKAHRQTLERAKKAVMDTEAESSFDHRLKLIDESIDYRTNKLKQAQDQIEKFKPELQKARASLDRLNDKLRALTEAAAA